MVQRERGHGVVAISNVGKRAQASPAVVEQ